MRLAFSFLLVLCVSAGCAPSADLSVPLPDRNDARGRLAIVRLAPVQADSSDAADTINPDALWDDLREELLASYDFSEVVYVDAPPDSILAEKQILMERAPMGSQKQGWGRSTFRVVPDASALAPEADVMLVLDDIWVTEGQRANPVAGFGVGGFMVGMALPQGRGVTVSARALMYRKGTADPTGAGAVAAYGRGGGFFENKVDEGSSERAISAFARQLAFHGGFARR